MVKQIVNKYKFIFLLLIICVIAIFMCSCGKEKKVKKDSEIYVYYTDKNQTKLVYDIYEPENEDSLKAVEEVLEYMNKTKEKAGMITAKPDTVNILGYGIYDNTLSINFGMAYNEMNKVTELLCRSAMVLTMTQLKGIDYVNFSVNGEPLCLEPNEPVGSMKAEDFVDDGASNINSFQNLNVVLYYSDLTGKKLEAVDYQGVYHSNTSVEKMIIERLIKGPTKSQCQRTLPSDLKLRSVMTKDGICYVDFDEKFLEGDVGVSPDIEIYSIVNSLSELSYINKVQISVNGDTNVKLRDSISLEYPFIRNLDIVK